MSAQGVETKAQRVERLKREKNPWECLEEIQRFARDGFDAIPPDWLKTYFRWWGVYTQGDGVGAVGGKGGEGKAVPYFMVRIRITNGILQSHQLRTIADLAAKYARGIADLTVRQNVQLHWVAVEDLPGIFASLWRCGLTTLGSCGDDTRNITGCPLAGVDADEVVDASSLTAAASRMLNGNPAFYNLPRKYKISITGCRVWCSYPEINDIGLTAAVRERRGAPEVGFSVRVGGGLSTDPHLGVRLNAFVGWNQVLPVVRGITEIFRDAESLRQNRERARLKFLFLREGWTAERFQEELEARIGFRLDPAVPEAPPEDIYRDHVGIHPQRQAGYHTAGIAVLRGRLTAEQMARAADLADRYGTGELRTTIMQNLLILNVPTRHVDRLARDLEAAGLRLEASPFWRGAIACTGTEFCKLAITETKSYAQWLVGALEERLPGFGEHLKIHITGCPNSCGQHWIADLGLEGKKLKVDGKLVDAYYFCLGGAVGKHQAIARPVGYRCLADEVPAAVARLLTAFLGDRRDGENFRQYCARHSDEALRALLAGAEVAAAARDPSPGRPPHGVGG
ncbi:MAG: nitrite/sulfite reductase [candidate division NC10 bacterium]|nr:nitrite/sulfite reductase [candidate division NC10 bacterium]